MSSLPIYMDHHATTPVDDRVLAAMTPYFNERFGNAASTAHGYGRAARDAVEEGRACVAALLDCKPEELIFTSGATESDNLAIVGSARAREAHGNHIVTVRTEHKAVLDPCKRLGREGWEVTVVPVDRTGQVDPDAVRGALRDDTVLVSVMLANNEVGTINPLGEIGELCKQRGVLLHSDATQAVGKVPVDVEELGVDLLSCSAHKLYGPKGVGALYVRRRSPQVRIEPMIDGGGHERGMRSGTLAVPSIVGFGKACELCGQEMQVDAERIGALRDRLHRGIVERIEQVTLNGHATERLAGNLNLSFAFVEGEALMMSMKDVAVSSGSACTSANPEPSHVLLAMGIGEELTRASIRFGLGRFNTDDEVTFAIDALADAVSRLRAMSSVSGVK